MTQNIKNLTGNLTRHFVILFMTICSGISQINNQNDPVDRKLRDAFSGLGFDSQAKDVEKNLAILKLGGIKTLFILAGELENKKLASRLFDSTSKMNIDPETHKVIGFDQKLLGEVAFDLIKDDVEGRIPFDFQYFSAIRKDNVNKWLEKRRGKLLIDLRIDAVQEAIDNVTASTKSGTTPNKTLALSFFTDKKRMLLTSSGVSPK